MAAEVLECASSSYGKEIESCSYDMLISHDINVSVEFLMAMTQQLDASCFLLLLGQKKTMV